MHTKSLPWESLPFEGVRRILAPKFNMMKLPNVKFIGQRVVPNEITEPNELSTVGR